jgi:hypothetical protein
VITTVAAIVRAEAPELEAVQDRRDIFWCIAPASVFDDSIVTSRLAVSMSGTAIVNEIEQRKADELNASEYAGKVSRRYQAREHDPAVDLGGKRYAKRRKFSACDVEPEFFRPEPIAFEDLDRQRRTLSDLRDRAEEILYSSFDPYMERTATGPPLFARRELSRDMDDRILDTYAHMSADQVALHEDVPESRVRILRESAGQCPDGVEDEGQGIDHGERVLLSEQLHSDPACNWHDSRTILAYGETFRDTQTDWYTKALRKLPSQGRRSDPRRLRAERYRKQIKARSPKALDQLESNATALLKTQSEPSIHRAPEPPKSMPRVVRRPQEARKWLVRYGGDIEELASTVRAGWQNDPKRREIRETRLVPAIDRIVHREKRVRTDDIALALDCHRDTIAEIVRVTKPRRPRSARRRLPPPVSSPCKPEPTVHELVLQSAQRGIWGALCENTGLIGEQPGAAVWDAT